MIRKVLVILEIIAALSFTPARAQDVEALGHVGDLREFLPLTFEGMPQPSYFRVNPDLPTLVVSREFIAEHRLWDYHFEREIHSPEAAGGLVAGDLVRFYVLLVGNQALRDVRAVICDECEESAGRSILSSF